MTSVPVAGIPGQAPPRVDDSYKSGWPTYEVIREVAAAEAPMVRARCLEELGYPHTIGERDGAYEYGPFTEEQWLSFEMASEQCAQQYPTIDGDAIENPSEEQLISLYVHQRDTWVPCMRELGIELGELPSEESFVANQAWVDIDVMNAEIEAALQAGTIEHSNAWMSRCPDRPDGWPGS